MRRYLLTAIGLLGFLSIAGTAEGQAPPPDGAAIYRERCAACHDGAQARIPSRDSIASLSLQNVIDALSTGVMRSQAAGLRSAEIRAVAGFVTTRSQPSANAQQPTVNPTVDVNANRCGDNPRVQITGASWNGWGRDLDNSRYQPDPGIKAENVPKLKLKWAFAYPGALAQGQPTIVGNRLYVTSESGAIFSLNAQTGSLIGHHSLTRVCVLR